MENEEIKFIELLQKEREKLNSFQFELNKDISEKMILNISQKRNFYLHITTLALGLSGLTLFTDKVIHLGIFYLGLIMLVGLFILILQWFREIIDLESRQMKELQNQYNIPLDAKKKLIDQVASKEYSPNLVQEYISGIKSLPGRKEIAAEDEKIQKGRKDGLQNLDYFSEIVMFMLFLSIFLLIISLIKFDIGALNLLMIFFSILLIFSLSFQDYVLRIAKYISKGVDSLHKKLF